MKEQIIREVESLRDLLKKRNNSTYTFFEGILVSLESENSFGEAIDNLRSCYSITQYSDFNKSEEDILEKIVLLANDIAKK